MGEDGEPDFYWEFMVYFSSRLIISRRAVANMGKSSLGFAK